jgi:hypothetical protein
MNIWIFGYLDIWILFYVIYIFFHLVIIYAIYIYSHMSINYVIYL